MNRDLKIVVLDGYPAILEDLDYSSLEEFGQLIVYKHNDPNDYEGTIEKIGDADIAVTNKVIINSQMMDRMPKLKLIAVVATGYNIIDHVAARERGIPVTNIPSYSTNSVAQMVFAHMLNITNRVDHYAAANRNGRWCKSPDFAYCDFVHHELAGMTLGIIGVGNIGTKVAAIANAFGMKVIAHTHRQQEDLPVGIEKVALNELLKTSDVVSLHCPLNKDTQHIINSQTLSMMKPSAILINTGRGPLVCETDLAAALSKGQIAAYAADVMSQEPPQTDNSLLKAPNAFFTPHIAWATLQARTRLLNILTDNIRAFTEGKAINVVN